MSKPKEGYHLKVGVWVTKKAGRMGDGDTWQKGRGVVFRTTFIKERLNWSSALKRLSKICRRWDGLDCFYYVRVSYGNFEDNFGKISEFYNDGEYTSAKESVGALKDFLTERGNYRNG